MLQRSFSRWLLAVAAGTGLWAGAGLAPVLAQEDDTVVKVKEGDKAPNVALPATQIEKVFPEKKDSKTLRLQDFREKKNVVLFFFPKALTPG